MGNLRKLLKFSKTTDGGSSKNVVDSANKPATTPKIAESLVVPAINNSSKLSTQNNFTNPQTKQDNTFIVPLKKKNKKLLIFVGIFMAFVLLLSAIAGMLLKKDPTPVPGTKSEIVWWGLGNDEAVYKSIIDEYQSKNPDVEIRYIKQNPQDYRERLISSLNKKQGPDIFRMHNSWVPMLIDYLDKMPQTVMTSEDFTKSYYPVIVRDLNIIKDFVGVPLEYDALTMFVNEDILASAGKRPPETWDELKDLAYELTTKDKNKILQSGVALGTTNNVDFWQETIATLMLQNGVDLSNPGAKAGPASDAYIYFTQFVNAGKETWNDTMPPSTKAFAQGKVAIYFGTARAAEEILKENPKFRFRTYPLPQVRKDDPEIPDISYASYWVEGVWVNSTKKQAVWDFVKYLIQKESLIKINSNLNGSGRQVQFIYPRIDMAEMQIDEPIAGSIVALAPHAKSWYLASNTYDGEKGLNTQINKVYESLVIPIKVNKRNAVNIAASLSQKIPPILAQYQSAIR